MKCFFFTCCLEKKVESKTTNEESEDNSNTEANKDEVSCKHDFKDEYFYYNPGIFMNTFYYFCPPGFYDQEQ